MTDELHASEGHGQPRVGTVKTRLSILRHDLRTPVNAILGYGEMLLEDAGSTAPADFQATLQELPTLGKQLLGLINNILDPSKLEAQGDQLNLDDLGASLRRQLQRPATLVFHNAESLIGRAGPAGLEDFIPDLERIREAGRRLLVMIGDALNMSRFCLEAPPQPAVTGGTSAAEASAPTVDEAQLHGHLLVVDDNDFNRDILGRAVTRQGHTFTEAPDGRRALETIRAQSFDLVLLDVNMPGLNGVQVLEQLKADIRLRHIPVIMISALDEIDTVVRCIEMGAEDYLAKPFDPVLLKARIGACLEKKRLRDQELEYLRNVAVITTAVSEVEAGTFHPESVAEVAARTDALGKLAKMFQNMIREVQAREQRLKQEVLALRVEIDVSRKARQVAEVTETSYFQDLQRKVSELRSKRSSSRG